MIRRCVLRTTATLIALAIVGCHRDMRDQPRYEPFEESEFFHDGMSARPPVPGTIAVGQLLDDEAFFTGKEAGKLIDELPLELTSELLERGQDRFTIYCSMCHGLWGNGDGMIVARGL